MEVKSSSKVKDEHLPDLAFQHHVLSKLGVPVAGLEILYINSECIYPDLSDLYKNLSHLGAQKSINPVIASITSKGRSDCTL